VLDPFAGSGTVGVVALRHGRRFIGCELNAEYAQMARRRVAGPLFSQGEPSPLFSQGEPSPAHPGAAGLAGSSEAPSEEAGARLDAQGLAGEAKRLTQW